MNKGANFTSLKSVAVFCGSKFGAGPEFRQCATELARELVKREIDLVYGGGKVGLMGVIADEVLSLGGKVFGVIPKKILDLEVGHFGITELEVVETMHERKHRMAELADAFIAIPGGIGTIEEIVEVFSWYNLDYHSKPCAILNHDGYFDSLVEFFNNMVEKEFISTTDMGNLIVRERVQDLINEIERK